MPETPTSQPKAESQRPFLVPTIEVVAALFDRCVDREWDRYNETHTGRRN